MRGDSGRLNETRGLGLGSELPAARPASPLVPIQVQI